MAFKMKGYSAFTKSPMKQDDGTTLKIDGHEVTQDEWNTYNKQGDKPDYVKNPELHKVQPWGRLPRRLGNVTPTGE